MDMLRVSESIVLSDGKANTGKYVARDGNLTLLLVAFESFAFPHQGSAAMLQLVIYCFSSFWNPLPSCNSCKSFLCFGFALATSSIRSITFAAPILCSSTPGPPTYTAT
jgi:hypothetical protein